VVVWECRGDFSGGVDCCGGAPAPCPSASVIPYRQIKAGTEDPSPEACTRCHDERKAASPVPRVALCFCEKPTSVGGRRGSLLSHGHAWSQSLRGWHKLGSDQYRARSGAGQDARGVPSRERDLPTVETKEDCTEVTRRRPLESLQPAQSPSLLHRVLQTEEEADLASALK